MHSEGHKYVQMLPGDKKNMGEPIKVGIIGPGDAVATMAAHWADAGLPGMVRNSNASKVETLVLAEKLNRSSQRLIPVVGAAVRWFLNPGEVNHEISTSICSKRSEDCSVDKI